MRKQYMFRAKKMLADGIPGEWVHGSNLWSGQCERPHTTMINGTPVVGDTLGQYSNIDDSNGKEIYEGDLLLFENQGQGSLREVVFAEGCFCAIPVNYGKGICAKEWGLFNNPFKGKVVGNVHDNPDFKTEV